MSLGFDYCPVTNWEPDCKEFFENCFWHDDMISLKCNTWINDNIKTKNHIIEPIDLVQPEKQDISTVSKKENDCLGYDSYHEDPNQEMKKKQVFYSW